MNAGKSAGAALGFVKGRWQDVSSGLWLLPGAIAVFGLVLAAFLLRVDQGLGNIHASFLFEGSPSAARSILSTIAGSLITVAGLVFSLTITTLQLASNQFTPRALRGFLRDRITQVVAGGFVGIFAYCLLVLTAVRSKNESGSSFVPSVGVTVAIVLAFLGLALLLLFIHHTTQSIQVSNITARLARETLSTIARLYPADAGRPLVADGMELVRSWRAAAAPCLIYAAQPGYVQSIELDNLARAMAKTSLCFHLAVYPGDFVAPETVVAELWPAARVDDRVRSIVRRNVTIVPQRDVHQDAAYGVRQLADIALRALSPGINDPTTAVTAIGYLRAILTRLARQDLPSPVRREAGDAESEGDRDAVTIVARQRTFEEYAEVLVEIGRYATDNARVAAALLDALADVAMAVAAHGDPRRMVSLSDVADAVAGPAIADARTEHDRQLLAERRARVARLTGG